MTCVLLPGQCLARVPGTSNNVSLTGEEGAGASASPSGGSSKHSFHGHKLDRERGEECVCVRGKREGDGVKAGLCVCEGRGCAGAEVKL